MDSNKIGEEQNYEMCEKCIERERGGEESNGMKYKAYNRNDNDGKPTLKTNNQKTTVK